MADQSNRSKGQIGVMGAEVSSGHWMTGLRSVLRNAVSGATAEHAVVGVVQQTTISCSSGGTMTTSYDDAAQLVGQTITINLSACKEWDGSVGNGTLVLTINKVDREQQPTEMTIRFDKYSYTEGAVTYALGGSMKLSETADEYKVNAPALTMKATGGGLNESEEWSNFNYSENISVPGVRKVSFDGGLISSDLDNKSVTLKVTKPFEFVGMAEVPNAGELLITGSNKSTVVLAVKDEVSPVTLTVDADGDGKVDRTSSKNWIDIAGSDFN